MKIAQDIFWPPVVDDKFLHVARKRLVGSTSLAIPIVGVVSGLAAFIATNGNAPMLLVIAMIAPFLLLLAPYLAWRTDKVVLAGRGVTGFLLIYFATLSSINNGSLWPAALLLSGVPLLASFVQGPRDGWVASLCVVIAFIGLTQFALPASVALCASMMVVFSMIAMTIFQRQLDATTTRLSELRQETEQAMEAKAAFLADMSHEIRTPLSGVVGIFDLLGDICPEDEQKKLITVGKSSSSVLLTIINDILDYSKIEASGVQLDRISFPRDMIVDGVFSMLGHMAREKGLRFELSIDESIPAFLHADPTRLQQVVMNFVSNAIKFTEKGVIEIKMERGEFESEVKVLVSDTGIGMSPDACTRVFEKYQQADKTINRKFGGTGLGLAISRELVELHDGKIGVLSEEGVGSTFWFTFPLVQGDPLRPNLDAMPLANQRLFPGADILVAEDNKTNRLIVRRFLEKLGANPVFAEDGQQAVQKTTLEKYDLILMDIQMPNMDGLEATRLIRHGSNPNSKTPIVALSANVLPSDKKSFVRAGMTGSIPKPLKFEQLIDLLCEYIEPNVEQSDDVGGDIGLENEIVKTGDITLH